MAYFWRLAPGLLLLIATYWVELVDVRKAMSERFDKLFPIKLLAGVTACGLAFAAALYLLARVEILDGAIIAGVTWFAFRWFWGTTLRNRELSRRGYFTGARVGAYWVYEELHDGMIQSIELPLDYVGRGEYDIHVPGERDWAARMPDWARERRGEIIERLQTVFKRSQIHFEPDSPTPPLDA